VLPASPHPTSEGKGSKETKGNSVYAVPVKSSVASSNFHPQRPQMLHRAKPAWVPLGKNDVVTRSKEAD